MTANLQLNLNNPPLMTCVPDSIKPLLTSKWMSGAEGDEGKSHWQPPARATQDQITTARLFVNQALAARPPATKEQLADRCSALLAHFFTAAHGEKINAMVARDWVQILAPFPFDVLKAAVRRYLETSTNRPKPVEIRELCISFYGWKDWQQLERARQIADMLPSEAPPKPTSGTVEGGRWQPPTAEQKAKVAALVANMHKKESPNG